MRKLFLLLLAIPLLIGASCNKQDIIVSNFEECIAAGNPAMESYPRQCRHNDRMFTEELVMPDQDGFEMSPYSHSGDLEDVSGGESSGTAAALFSEMSVVMHAEFQNLPVPEGTDFYEGWLVRQEPFDFISTGVAVMGLYPRHYGNDFVGISYLNGYDF